MKSWLATLVVLLTAVCNCAQADLIFTVDMDTATAGIQNSITVNGGQNFSVNLILQTTAPTVLSGYSVTVQYDTSELDGVLGSSSQARPANWIPLGTLAVDDPIPVNNTTIAAPTGQFKGIAAGSLLPADDVPAPFTLTIASLNFTATAGPNFDGVIDIIPGFFVQGIDNGTGTNVGTISFVGGTVNINAVPEPSTWVLSSLALSMGVVAKRRRSRAAAAPR